MSILARLALGLIAGFVASGIVGNTVEDTVVDTLLGIGGRSSAVGCSIL